VSVAVAVVSWNTRDLLRACLESLHADADAGRAEVWVVDNASADGSAALVRSAFPWVRLLALDENLGFGRAVNRVAARTARRIAAESAVTSVDNAAERSRRRDPRSLYLRRAGEPAARASRDAIIHALCSMAFRRPIMPSTRARTSTSRTP